MLELLLAGVLLLLATPGLYLVSRHYHRLARTVRATEIHSIAELHEVYGRVSSEMGAGLFAQRVAIQGLLECEEPLRSELAELACAAYRYRVERQWEETTRERDAEGRAVLRTRTGSETVAALERRAPFWVRDGAGRVLVRPDGAQVEWEKVVDRFQPEGVLGAHSGRAGSGLWPLPLRDGRRTLGYRLSEWLLPPDREVYVLGTATDGAGSLCIERTTPTDGPFMISLQGRRRLAEEAERIGSLVLYGACVCLPVGFTCIAIALWLWRHGLRPA